MTCAFGIANTLMSIGNNTSIVMPTSQSHSLHTQVWTTSLIGPTAGITTGDWHTQTLSWTQVLVSLSPVPNGGTKTIAWATTTFDEIQVEATARRTMLPNCQSYVAVGLRLQSNPDVAGLGVSQMLNTNYRL